MNAERAHGKPNTLPAPACSGGESLWIALHKSVTVRGIFSQRPRVPVQADKGALRRSALSRRTAAWPCPPVRMRTAPLSCIFAECLCILPRYPRNVKRFPQNTTRLGEEGSKKMFSRGNIFFEESSRAPQAHHFNRVRQSRTPQFCILHSAFCIFHSAFAPHHWSIIKKVKVPVATSFPSALDSSTWITDRVCPSFLGVATQVI